MDKGEKTNHYPTKHRTAPDAQRAASESLSVSVQLHTSLLFSLFCLPLSPSLFCSKKFQARSLQILSKEVFQDSSSSSLIDSSVLFPSLCISALPFSKVSDLTLFARPSPSSFLFSLPFAPPHHLRLLPVFSILFLNCFRQLSLSSIFLSQSFPPLFLPRSSGFFPLRFLNPLPPLLVMIHSLLL